MSGSVIEPLVAAAHVAHGDFARLILVAGGSEVQRARVLCAVAERLGRPVFLLSGWLLTMAHAWPGPLQDGFLSYDRPGHPEFHRISTGGVLYFSLEEVPR